MLKIDPQTTKPQVFYKHLSQAIAPRPIALVATLSKEGKRNLAPFSFFNIVSISPPLVAFSPLRRGRDGSLKDTYLNLIETRECSIQIVTRELVEQVNICSMEFPGEEDEFEKSGLTAIPSEHIETPRVKESPIQMECRLYQSISFGEQAMAGNLMICEIVGMHINEAYLSDQEELKAESLHLVGRNGAAFYTECTPASLFEVEKLKGKHCIGYHALPEFVKLSSILTARHISLLAAHDILPEKGEVEEWIGKYSSEGGAVQKAVSSDRIDHYEDLLPSVLLMKDISTKKLWLEKIAKSAIDAQDIHFAWKVVIYIETL